MKNLIEDIEFSTFYVGTTLCGITIMDIQEINKNVDITSVPQSSDYVKGILNLRGKIITIIDLGKKLGLDPVKKNRENKNIIINSGNELIGLFVDAIGDVVHASNHDIDPAPSNIGALKGRYFQGVLKNKKRLIGILNMDEVLND